MILEGKNPRILQVQEAFSQTFPSATKLTHPIGIEFTDRRKQLTKDQRRQIFDYVTGKSRASRERNIYAGVKRSLLGNAFFPDAPDKEPKYTAKRNKWGQNSSAGVGVTAARVLGRLKKTHGKSLFRFDAEKAAEATELIKRLQQTDATTAAKVLAENEEILLEALIQEAYKQFQKDISYIGQAKTMTEGYKVYYKGN
jgi:hypothetical protein